MQFFCVSFFYGCEFFLWYVSFFDGFWWCLKTIVKTHCNVWTCPMSGVITCLILTHLWYKFVSSMWIKVVIHWLLPLPQSDQIRSLCPSFRILQSPSRVFCQSNFFDIFCAIWSSTTKCSDWWSFQEGFGINYLIPTNIHPQKCYTPKTLKWGTLKNSYLNL